MEEVRSAFKEIKHANLLERDLWGYQGVDGRIILQYVLKNWVSIRETGLILPRIGISEESL